MYTLCLSCIMKDRIGTGGVCKYLCNRCLCKCGVPILSGKWQDRNTIRFYCCLLMFYIIGIADFLSDIFDGFTVSFYYNMRSIFVSLRTLCHQLQDTSS